MPCNNFDEHITVYLLGHRFDVVGSYRLLKHTCNATIGAPSLLKDLVNGQSVTSVFALRPNHLMNHYGVNPQELFLYDKHRLALQAALRVICGIDHGGPEAHCTTLGVVHQIKSLHYRGRITVAHQFSDHNAVIQPHAVKQCKNAQ